MACILFHKHIRLFKVILMAALTILSERSQSWYSAGVRGWTG